MCSVGTCACAFLPWWGPASLAINICIIIRDEVMCSVGTCACAFLPWWGPASPTINICIIIRDEVMCSVGTCACAFLPWWGPASPTINICITHIVSPINANKVNRPIARTIMAVKDYLKAFHRHGRKSGFVFLL